MSLLNDDKDFYFSGNGDGGDVLGDGGDDVSAFLGGQVGSALSGGDVRDGILDDDDDDDPSCHAITIALLLSGGRQNFN